MVTSVRPTFQPKSSMYLGFLFHFSTPLQFKLCCLEFTLFFSLLHSHFESNVAFGLEESLTDVAAMRLYRVHLLVNGTSLFCNNSGGGLEITQGRVDVVATVTFEENTAIIGAAVRLFGRTEVSSRRS